MQLFSRLQSTGEKELSPSSHDTNSHHNYVYCMYTICTTDTSKARSHQSATEMLVEIKRKWLASAEVGTAEGLLTGFGKTAINSRLPSELWTRFCWSLRIFPKRSPIVIAPFPEGSKLRCVSITWPFCAVNRNMVQVLCSSNDLRRTTSQTFIGGISPHFCASHLPSLVQRGRAPTAVPCMCSVHL